MKIVVGFDFAAGLKKPIGFSALPELMHSRDCGLCILCCILDLKFLCHDHGRSHIHSDWSKRFWVFHLQILVDPKCSWCSFPSVVKTTQIRASACGNSIAQTKSIIVISILCIMQQLGCESDTAQAFGLCRMNEMKHVGQDSKVLF